MKIQKNSEIQPSLPITEFDFLQKYRASFDKSVRLYEFDKKLRNILSFYLHDIEVNLRTKVIYYISNRYKENPIWFSDNQIVMQSFINSFAKK